MWRRHDIGLVPRARISKFAVRINLRGGFTRVGGRTWNATSLPPGRITLTPRSQPARAAFAGRSATARRHARTCAAIEQPDVPPRMALLSICRRFCRCARAHAPGREAPAITLSGTRDVCGSTLPHTPVFPHAQCGPLERMRKTGFHFPQMRHFPEWVGARVGGLRMSAPRNKAHNGNSLRRRASPTACALQQHSRMPHSAGSRLRLPVSERGFYPAHGQDMRAFSSETTLGKFLTAPITHCI